MEVKLLIAVFLCFVSRGDLAKHKKYSEVGIKNIGNPPIFRISPGLIEGTYNDIQVTFPRDLCDATEIPMPDFSARNRRISEVKCREHVWRLRYEQGKEKRLAQCNPDFVPLLGGTAAADGEYPHMVALGWKAKVGTWIFKCGGSLISERYVLTAAHCSSLAANDETVADIKPKIVRLGCKSILDYNIGGPAYDVNITKFIKYPRYNSPKQYYDIALLYLEKDVSFTWFVHPACLWTLSEVPEKGNLTGWGIVATNALTASPVLQKAETTIIDTYECDKRLEHKRNGRKWWGMKKQLCAGDVNGRIDTCQGDSGGPLQTLIPLDHPRSVLKWNLHNIVGVTSFGFGCGKVPGVYTRVSSFITWIESKVWPPQRKTKSNVRNRFLFGA